ncbi:hypothetical protein [Actinoplanes sp. NPDC026623]|uniref:hypothetical protein n=1 Tax=Actinoplanes sp. NPDC026623 TaxID=3155610 RepID=UPI003404EF12
MGTFALLLAVAATTAFSVFCLVADLALRQALQAGGADDASPMLIWAIEHADGIAGLNLVLLVVYLAGFLIWRRGSRSMLRRLVDDPEAPLRHWSIVVWNLAIVASVLITASSAGSDPRNLDETVSALSFEALRWGVRSVGLGVLLIGIVQIRGQIRRAVAEPRVPAPAAPRPEPAPIAYPPAPATDGTRPVRVLEPVPGSEGLPPADDAFWNRVRDAAAGADVALLERTGLQAYGWKLVPAGGDGAEVRAALRPGAVVTAFTESPSAQAPGKKYKPVAADEYHGFLESGETGAIWYQPVDRFRLPAFLGRAGSSGRWALYPVEDDAALRAVVPAE